MTVPMARNGQKLPGGREWERVDRGAAESRPERARPPSKFAAKRKSARFESLVPRLKVELPV